MKLTLLADMVFLAAVLVVACAGCNRQESGSSPGKTETAKSAIVKLSTEQLRLKERAIVARDHLFKSLLDELTRSMMEHGPVKSISVCKERAPAIARRVSAETGVLIGRTSFKLRNQENIPPDWAVSFVNDKVEHEVAVELPDRGLGVLSPIRLQTTCTLCHGNDQQIMPEVKAAIVTNYRNDKATGFAEGDLRGYFWMEVSQQTVQGVDQ